MLDLRCPVGLFMARFDARLFWAFYSLIQVPRDEHLWGVKTRPRP
jgi:hypothetical protein